MIWDEKKTVEIFASTLIQEGGHTGEYHEKNAMKNILKICHGKIVVLYVPDSWGLFREPH